MRAMCPRLIGNDSARRHPDTRSLSCRREALVPTWGDASPRRASQRAYSSSSCKRCPQPARRLPPFLFNLRTSSCPFFLGAYMLSVREPGANRDLGRRASTHMAESTQTLPTTAFIFASASLVKYVALTMSECSCLRPS